MTLVCISMMSFLIRRGDGALSDLQLHSPRRNWFNGPCGRSLSLADRCRTATTPRRRTQVRLPEQANCCVLSREGVFSAAVRGGPLPNLIPYISRRGDPFAEGFAVRCKLETPTCASSIEG